MLQSIAECCSVLQSVVECCMCYSVLQRGSAMLRSLRGRFRCQFVAVCCSVLQCVAVSALPSLKTPHLFIQNTTQVYET